MKARILAAALAVAAPSFAPWPPPPAAGSLVPMADTRPAFIPTSDTRTDDPDLISGSGYADAATDRDDRPDRGGEDQDAGGAPVYAAGGWSTAARSEGYTAQLPVEDPARLARLIEDVPGADGYRYSSIDSAGNGMDTAKVIDNPAGGYLAVYHWADKVKLATSSDLLNWRYVTDLDPRATQPTIVASPDGGFVVAFETEGADNGHVKVVHYPDLAALYAGRADRTFTAPRTLSRCNEGTPSITSVRPAPDIDHSVIELGLHYHHNCDTDREAVARLTNFRRWKATAASSTDRALTAAAAELGRTIRGNIGDRDSMAFAQRLFSITEVQYAKGQFGTWQPYLYDPATRRASALNVRTHRGSRAFANPTFTRITAPDGSPAIVVTLYVPWQGAALFEAGELIYYRRLSPGAAPTPAAHIPAAPLQPEPSHPERIQPSPGPAARTQEGAHS